MALDTIVLIDDSEATNIYHELVLLETFPEIKVIDFTNCQKAIQFIQNNSFTSSNTLFLLDLNMPEMDGWEFLAFVEKIKEKNEQLKFIFLSTAISQNDKIRAKKHPFIVDLLTKPIEVSKIKEIQNLLF
jgi:response regulator RpfG family c-di-GMP phosphodiesterase